MELIKAFGLDYKHLIANLVNFILLFYILKKVLYGPLLKFIQERTQKIEEGLKNAENAEKVFTEAKTQQEEVLTAARKEASEIIEKSKIHAQVQAQTMIDQTKQETQALLEKARVDIDAQHKQMMQSAKKEIVSVVVQVAEKLLRERITPEKDAAVLKNTLNEVK